MTGDPIQFGDFIATTLGLLTFLVGYQITRKVRFLRDFNIPEPVSGGLIAALVAYGVFLVWQRPVQFDLFIRDYLLVIFFSAIGLNARLADLVRGGRPLVLLLAATVGIVLIQNVIGAGVALGFGLPAEIGVLVGSASLIGGHGTAIAWTPAVAEASGFAAAEELGIAAATIGLVLAALVGGPVAKYLIERYGLTPARPDLPLTVGVPFEEEQALGLTAVDVMRAMFWLHAVVLIGFYAHAWLAGVGVQLPLFVPCMLTGILLGNLVPALLPRLPKFTHTTALSLISELALGVFLAMSLMALQLWTLSGLGLLLITVMVLQTAAAILFMIFVVFPVMGRSYFAAVLSAGFGGFALGATPTAIANMSAVTQRYGPSPLAFVVLPLVAAFFVDLVNAAVIQAFLSIG